ncbi:PREDICTED: RWD domain-containing protein 1-like [Priapulus caudatus]|uniref:RWD domain-containing protein 1-like n=1 Tax=Priapulus caudatus TaxID=37621 RepID=A0ABM1EZI5_PRICU|nr:PREDICTED: RWD domain-containing protein 1-like [Priapulus caudatus]
MTDYAQEQQDEIEAIQSIYPEEYEEISTDPTCFSVFVQTEDYEDDTDVGAACTLQFTYTPTYPDEVPLVEITNYENITDEDDVEELQQLLLQQAEENVGMVMVFTLVSALQDLLHERIEKKKEEEEQIRSRKKEQEEAAEMARFEGTRVNIETFMSWKQKFDEERRLQKEKKVDTTIKLGKLTGKELFMRDVTLNESDIQFLDDGEDEGVTIDESLFEDLDDLDIED